MKLAKVNVMRRYVLCALFLVILSGCKQSRLNETETKMVEETIKTYKSFGEDISFLEEYTDITLLKSPTGNGMVAVSAALQGRVMTSTSSGLDGRSQGWINRSLFESGDTLDHMNAFGGEERFWLGPEGGQYSIFFEKGVEFNLETWQTPRLIDLDPFHLKEATERKATFTKDAVLTNYSGFTFEFGIEREVAILSKDEVINELGLSELHDVEFVAYRTINTLSNKGSSDWKKETGLLSIWLLGMFKPSEQTTVVIPYVPGEESVLGKVVNDEYFGKVPGDRLIVKDKVIYFKGDGQLRSKIGLLPSRALNALGSYDAINKTLTIVKYDKPGSETDYVNSLWELQDNPYKGDVLNSYNDGPPAPGEKPLGPFYELETSSPALALKSGDSGIHVQLTCHFVGSDVLLNEIALSVLKVSIDEITSVF